MSEATLTAKNQLTVSLIRFLHGLAVVVLTICLVLLYYSVYTKQTGLWLILAIPPLMIELVLLLIYKDCPLTLLHHKYGDSTGFFGLFLPEKIVRYVIPSYTIITSLGISLLICNYFNK